MRVHATSGLEECVREPVYADRQTQQKQAVWCVGLVYLFPQIQNYFLLRKFDKRPCRLLTTPDARRRQKSTHEVPEQLAIGPLAVRKFTSNMKQACVWTAV